MDFFYREREMILYATLLFVGVWRNVEHVFDPVVSIRNLNLPPVIVGVLEATVPIHAEAEKVSVEAVFDRGVLDDESGMDHASANLLSRRGEEARGRELDEGNGVALRIEKLEMLDAVGIFLDVAGGDFVRCEVAAHLFDVGSGEGDFGEEICGSAGGYLEELNLLAVVDGVTGIGDPGAACCAGRQTENMGVELARFAEIRGVHADTRDAGNRRARGLVLRSERKACETCEQEEEEPVHLKTNAF